MSNSMTQQDDEGLHSNLLNQTKNENRLFLFLRKNLKLAVPIAAIFIILLSSSLAKSSVYSHGISNLFFPFASRIKVAAYYYPWYGDGEFHGGGYIRSELTPSQLPYLGEYDDTDSSVIEQHIEWSHQARISVWVASWWGEGSLTDNTLLNYVLTNEKFDLEFAIHYETEGLTNNFTDFDSVSDDITYLASTYFSHSNYLHINGRPVIYIYEAGALFLAGELGDFVTLIREAASALGYDIYIVADAAYGNPIALGATSQETLSNAIQLIDALTTYDTYGAMGVSSSYYAGQNYVNSFFQDQALWKKWANSMSRGFMPTVTPGFNDNAIRDGHPPISRKLTKSAAFGTLFKAMLKKATKMVDKRAENIMMLTSFNEWHEDTQIEPVATQNYVSVDEQYGTGLEYEAYGEKYLNILRRFV